MWYFKVLSKTMFCDTIFWILHKAFLRFTTKNNWQTNNSAFFFGSLILTFLWGYYSYTGAPYHKVNIETNCSLISEMKVCVGCSEALKLKIRSCPSFKLNFINLFRRGADGYRNLLQNSVSRFHRTQYSINAIE